MNLAKYHNKYRKDMIRKAIKVEQEKLAAMTDEEREEYLAKQKELYEQMMKKPEDDSAAIEPEIEPEVIETVPVEPTLIEPNVGRAAPVVYESTFDDSEGEEA